MDGDSRLENIINDGGPAFPVWELNDHEVTNMADITMCTQTLCPNAAHCYRVQAKASSWQSMATFDYTISTHGVKCENYMPMYRTVATNSTVHNA